MKASYFMTGAVLVLGGCATPFRAPPDVAHVSLIRTDSPTIHVEKIWLERKQGPLVVTGYVMKQKDATDTTRTHLDVIIFDAAGRPLRRSVESFDPRQIPSRIRPSDNFSAYRVPLDPLPTGVASIEVRAHDDSEENCKRAIANHSVQ